MSFNRIPVASAALLLLASFGAAPRADATASADANVVVCAPSKRAVYQTVGHPGKSVAYKRREIASPKRCSSGAPKALVLASFIDEPGGNALVTGRTETALEQIAAERNIRTSAATLTNLCVAHTLQRQWAEARAACDAAVGAALNAANRNRDFPGTRLKMANKGVAVAYSNRAVMHWLSRDTVSAQQDLSRAREVAPWEGFVVRNSRLTMSLPAQAQSIAVSTPIG